MSADGRFRGWAGRAITASRQGLGTLSPNWICAVGVCQWSQLLQPSIPSFWVSYVRAGLRLPLALLKVAVA